MSEKTISFTVAGLELCANEEERRSIPTWLAEAVLVGQYWQSSGLLEHLNKRVKVNRGRMGQYEVCDFVLVMLAYAVSGLPSLAEFYRELVEPFKSVLMAVWGRKRCPVASTLSRFLTDVDEETVEQLRELFEEDLHRGMAPELKQLGLTDRTAQRWMVFDVDGTVKAVRHRVLLSEKSHPPLRRRSRNACAPGYGGRKRGQAIRNRTTVCQAHTREWLGNFAGAGNGDVKGDLRRCCEVIQRYCQSIELPLERALLRLDGLYGRANYTNILHEQQIPFITRCCDYHLLKDPTVKAHLAQEPQEQYNHADSPQMSRELFDIPFLDATARGYATPLRLIVLRLLRLSKSKPAAAKCQGKYLYETFLTSLPPAGFRASDVLSLYNGRGGFEQTLAEEDVEQDCDRWCSWHPQGQTFWQILSQSLWNWRLRAGWHSQPAPESVRSTLWAEAIEPSQDTSCELNSQNSDESRNDNLPQESANASASLQPSPVIKLQYGPMQVATAWKSSRRQFTGDDFKIIDDSEVQCPAGHTMDRQEIRHTPEGDMQMIFGVNSTTCRPCPLIGQCHSQHSKNTRGRRITVIRERLPDPQESSEGPILVIQPTPPQTTPPGHEAIVWYDLPATTYRRHLQFTLAHNQIEIEALVSQAAAGQTKLSRDQRAHRRLSWKQRLKRNRLRQPHTIQWKIQLFGISPALALFLKSMPGKYSEAF